MTRTKTTDPLATPTVGTRRDQAAALAASAWPLLACFGGLLALDRSGLAPASAAFGSGVPFLLVLLLAFVALWWALKRLRRPATGSRSEVPVAGMLAVAVLLRLLALPLSPSLSDDVYRYLWDGRVAASGANPYLATPNDESLVNLRDELWSMTAHRDVPTVYPPLALLMFTVTATMPRPLLAWKLTLAAVDLLGCVLLLALARRRRGNARDALAYVWNPLLVVEGVGMGHVDVLGASLVIACVWLLQGSGEGRRRRRCEREDVPPTSSRGTGRRTWLVTPSRWDPRHSRLAAAGAVAALAVLAKLVPLLALPLWWRHTDRRRRRHFTLGAASLLVPATLAVLLWTRGVPGGLVEYALRWEYNGPIHEPLWRLIGALRLDVAASGVVHLARVVAGGEVDAAPWNVLYSLTYPQFLSRCALLLATVLAWLRLWRRRPEPVRAAFGAFAIFLLMSPTFYPWYLIFILPWAALTGARAVLVLSATLPLAYLPALTGLPYFPLVYGAVWLPPLIVLLLERGRRAGTLPAAGRDRASSSRPTARRGFRRQPVSSSP